MFLDGDTRYRARVMAAPYRDSMWQGWIEFIPVAEGTPCRTEWETVQPDRGAVVYWAEGLEPLYLDGAFERACRGARTAPASVARSTR